MLNIYKQNGAGKIVDLLNLEDGDLDLDWIVTSLSRLPRFGGCTTVPYSVLQHTVIGTWVCEDLGYDFDTCKDFCGHDLGEGVMGVDIPTPIKRQCQSMIDIETNVENRLMARYGFKFNPQAKKVDYAMCYWEAHYLTLGGPTRNPSYWPEPEIEIADIGKLCLENLRNKICEIDYKKEFNILLEKYEFK